MKKIFTIMISIILIALVIYFFKGFYVKLTTPIENNNSNIEKNNIKDNQTNKKEYIDEKIYPYFGLLNNIEKEVYYDFLELANNYQKKTVELTNKISVES